MSNFYFGPVTGYDDERREDDYTPLHLSDERVRFHMFVLRCVFEMSLILRIRAAFIAVFVARMKPAWKSLTEAFVGLAETMQEAASRFNDLKDTARVRSREDLDRKRRELRSKSNRKRKGT